MPCNINAYTLCLGLFALVYGSFDTYLISMLTTLEKRFNLPSKLSGLLQGSSDFGYLLGVLPVSFYGRQAHRPRTMGGLGLLLSLGILIMSSPYYFFGPMPAGSGGSPASQSSSPSAGLLCNSTATTSAAAAAVAADGQQPLSRQSAVAYFVLVLGAFLVGVGSTPFWNLGLAYIDDHVSKVHAPVYISAMMALRFVAPVPGYIIGGQLAMLPESLLSGAAEHTGVGAWWLGFVCLSGLTACCSLIMFCFPRQLPRPDDGQPEEIELPTEKRLPPASDLDEPDGRALCEDGSAAPQEQQQHHQAADCDASKSGLPTPAKAAEAAAPGAENGDRPTPAVDLLNSVVSLDPASLVKTGLSHTLRRLAGNLTFLALLIGAALEFLAFMGFLAFLPKYYQVGFGVTTGEAGLYAGIVEGLSSALGTLGGGIFMNRARLSLSKLLALTTGVCLAIGLLGNIGALLECRATPEFTDFDSPAACALCDCDSRQYRPVCSGNASYLSPCLAGCSSFSFYNSTESPQPFTLLPSFEGCGCDAVASSSPTASPAGFVAFDGFCDGGGVGGGCSAALIAYNCIFFCLNLLAGAVKSIVCVIVIRAISARDKDIGFGFITFAASFSSTISPILYGAMIDAFCLHRDAASGGVFARCLLYNIAGIRISQHLLRSVLRILCGLAFVVATVGARSNPHIQRNEREIKRQQRGGGGGGGSSNGASAAPQEAG
ncbi:hypothetical protein BOX15_Mlig034225g2 [Macrostomum lignano]|uniref:Solute carrier organic anion transporter family member n=1 Tax=Macrostomum lignano TaxID=282301 RepID=A0A267E435_9PLAT|nr:hypothetical protein BOX15_Mlig034225g2 [Macrostomum lignano]